MDVRTMLLDGKYSETLEKYGKEKVRGELIEMIFENQLADKALPAAKALEYRDLTHIAEVAIKYDTYW